MSILRFRLILLASVLAAFCASPGQAASVCRDSSDMILNGASQTFCVSAFGSSTTWYPAELMIGSYDPARSVLGDSVQYLAYNGGGSWLAPSIVDLDWNASGGAPTSYTPGTAYSVNSSSSNGSSATSVIQDSTNTVKITIVSTPNAGGIRQIFSITNLTGAALSNVRFYEFVSMHPNGLSDASTGTPSYKPVPTMENTYVPGLWYQGVESSSYVRNVGVCGGVGNTGCAAPDGWAVDTPANVIAQVEGGTLLNASALTPNSAYAGALMWDIGSLAGGATQDVTIELVPEPAPWMLLASGAAMIAVLRKRVA